MEHSLSTSNFKSGVSTNSESEARRFVRKVTFFLAPLFTLTVIPFFVLDPFQIVHPMHGCEVNYFDGHGIYPNVDHCATQKLLSEPEKNKFTSFVLGNSRALGFRARDVAPYLGGKLPYFFAAPAESLFGLSKKIQFFDRTVPRLENLLLVLDRSVFWNLKNYTGRIFIKDPATSGESIFAFYGAYVHDYFSNLFYLKYLDFRVRGKFRPYMGDVVIEEWDQFDPVTNDWIKKKNEDELARDPVGFYERRKENFVRHPEYCKDANVPILDEPRIRILEEMGAILARHATKTKIVISPLYDQCIFNTEDLAVLRRIFGAENVYDYSGVNAITKDMTNYYEFEHYRPIVGREILKAIYSRR